MDLTKWIARPEPDLQPVFGRSVGLTPAGFPADGEVLFNTIGGTENDDLWTHIPIGPFDSGSTLGQVMKAVGEYQHWQTHLLRDAASEDVLGMASYMRIRPEHGSAEVGCIVFSKKLQRTPAATEAMYLMMRHIFDDLGYRRYEWKCNNANDASKRAAERLGFQFEGVFRNDMVVKGRNRDTAWYSITDEEWPGVKAALEAWLAPKNFDETGEQRKSLEAVRAEL